MAGVRFLLLFNRLTTGKDRKCNGNQFSNGFRRRTGRYAWFIVFETGCSLDTGLYTGTELRERTRFKEYNVIV
jgi:hypothetical protein